MKVSYTKNGITREFEPSIFNDYNNKRQDGSFYEWENTLAVIADCRFYYPRIYTYKECISDFLENYEFDLTKDDDQYFKDELYKFIVKALKREGPLSDFYVIQLKDCDLSEYDIVPASSVEEACKKYLLEHYADVINWIIDDKGKFIYLNKNFPKEDIIDIKKDYVNFSDTESLKTALDNIYDLCYDASLKDEIKEYLLVSHRTLFEKLSNRQDFDEIFDKDDREFYHKHVKLSKIRG